MNSRRRKNNNCHYYERMQQQKQGKIHRRDTVDGEGGEQEDEEGWQRRRNMWYGSGRVRIRMSFYICHRYTNDGFSQTSGERMVVSLNWRIYPTLKLLCHNVNGTHFSPDREYTITLNINCIIRHVTISWESRSPLFFFLHHYCISIEQSAQRGIDGASLEFHCDAL